MAEVTAERKDVEITVRIDEANLAALTVKAGARGPAVKDVALVPLGDGAYRLAIPGNRQVTLLRWCDVSTGEPSSDE